MEQSPAQSFFQIIFKSGVPHPSRVLSGRVGILTLRIAHPALRSWPADVRSEGVAHRTNARYLNPGCLCGAANYA